MFFACWTQVARVDGSMKPLASLAVAGFPMTILSRLTPAALISKIEELGKVPPDWLTRLVHVVYSLPSGNAIDEKNCVEDDNDLRL